MNFPGQQHRWKLSQLLQKGTERSYISLLNDLALALRFLVVTAKGRLISHFFSVSEAFKAFLRGFLRIIDLLIGLPSLQAHNLDTKIREERCKYLVAELICRVRVFIRRFIYFDKKNLISSPSMKSLLKLFVRMFEDNFEERQLKNLKLLVNAHSHQLLYHIAI